MTGKSGSEGAKPFRGLYRTVAWAYVSNGEMAFEYKPDFDSLPWKESYNADGYLEHPHAVPDFLISDGSRRRDTTVESPGCGRDGYPRGEGKCVD